MVTLWTFTAVVTSAKKNKEKNYDGKHRTPYVEKAFAIEDHTLTLEVHCRNNFHNACMDILTHQNTRVVCSDKVPRTIKKSDQYS